MGFGASQNNAGAVLEALRRSLALIEFNLDGEVLSANDNFCRALGYSEAEIVGKHHRLFVDSEYAQSSEYRAFWEKLRRGEYDARVYRRIGKGGREVWIQASYNPVFVRGAVVRVVKVATDITEEKRKGAEVEGKFNAISRVQAVIEFTTAGEVVDANDNFLAVLGYGRDEIIGKHHRMFVEPAYAGAREYEEFWAKLNRGEFVAAEFKRIGKGGKEVWIQASYNPIFDASGRVVKVVKFATDVSERVRAVNEIGLGLKRMAENDLERDIDRAFAPDFEPLRRDYNASLAQLRETLRRVAEAASSISAGSSQISGSSNDLSIRTERQAASLEETAAAMDQITATVAKSTEGALKATEQVAVADADAKNGADIVGKAVNAMDAISRSSSQISNIIGVIDEIAFQTNLLALNAGVEAARAGDTGRGFAVVAQEVRALAQRSADAAKEIKSLITRSSEQVGAGVSLVAETGQALERIMRRVSDINEIVNSIATGAKEQSTALGEVNVAINQMDQLTQQNAAMVEEANAASAALSSEARELTEALAQFKIGDPTRRGVRAPAPASIARSAV